MRRLLGVALFAFPVISMAVLPHAPSDAEVAALPQFCAVKYKRPGPNAEAQFGAKNWIHMHHYCGALKFVNRARNYPKDRNYYLANAKGEYHYMIKAAEPTFWFRPQMYVELAKVHLQLGERIDAQKWLFEAIVFNPRYEAAYLSLVEVQRTDGAQAEALETATRGLRNLPQSNALQKAYVDLGGKMPFPEPRPLETRPDFPPAPNQAALNESAADAKMNDGDAVSGAVQETDNSATSGCRFCPPDEIQQRWRESFQQGQ